MTRLLLLAAALAAPCPALAATCNVTPQSVSFGPYDPLGGAPTDGVGNIAVHCDASVAVTVAIGPGGGTFDDRKMTGATDLHYNLYTDASRLSAWGDGTGGGGTVSASGQDIELPVYGRIPGRQNVRAGAYSDTLVVTVTY